MKRLCKDIGMPSSEVMHEFKHGRLHSGSKHGPKVKNRKQAVAIMLSEARKEGKRVPKARAKGGRGRRKAR